MIKILIADDHMLFLKGMSMLFQTEQEKYKVIGTVHNGAQVVSFISEQEVDVVLIDINMPQMNGYEAILHTLKINPSIKFIALTMLADASSVRKVLEAGALGYLFKNVDEQELFACIEHVAQGGHYVTPSMEHILEEHFKKQKDIKKGYEKANANPLSVREIEILRLIIEGHTNQDIADLLFLSARTVDTHRKNILAKLQIKNTAALVKYALDHAPFLGLNDLKKDD